MGFCQVGEMNHQGQNPRSRSPAHQNYSSQQNLVYPLDSQIPGTQQSQHEYGGLRPPGGTVEYVPSGLNDPQHFGQMAAGDTSGFSDYYMSLTPATCAPQNVPYPSYYSPMQYEYDYQQEPYQTSIPITGVSISESLPTSTTMHLSPDPSSARASTSPTPVNQVRVVNSRPKPKCWEHGCNGREFSTFSNLLRHQREKAGTSAKTECPYCGTIFTRTAACNSHLSQGKCKGKQVTPE